MEKHHAIPTGYMRVGELAKKMGISVRTLQYYDKKHIFSPSAESEGGRRLYSDKDLITLHQILSLKHLGFSLDDIKRRLMPLESTADFASALQEQANDVLHNIETLNASLKEIEMLKAEVLQMQAIDFKKCADIIVNLQMKNEYYWLIKHFDEQTLDHIRIRFDQEKGLAFIKQFQQLNEEILLLKKNKVAPNSQKGQSVAKQFWDMLMDFTDGDMSLLPKLMEIGSFEGVNNEWGQKQALVNTFIEPALECYLSSINIQPFAQESL